jgi:hypothetical protein
MTTGMPTRNRTADLMKGLAVIFMIQVHLMELFCRQDIYDDLAGRISLFLGGIPAAPVFMLIMGYFIAKSRRTYTQSVIRGIKIILLGFALNIGLNLHLLIKILNGTFELDPLPYVFGVDIFFLAGLSIIGLALLKLLKTRQLLFSSLVLVLIFSLQLLFEKYFSSASENYLLAYFWGNNSWWSYFPLIPWFAYPLTGFIFFILEESLQPFIKKWLPYIFITYTFMVALFFDYGIDISSDLQAYYHHDYLFFIYAIFFMIAWAALSHYITENISNPFLTYIEWLGKYVTEAYVIQWLIIGNVATALYKTQSLTAFVFWFVFILSITSGGIWVWIRRSKLKDFISKN